MWEDPSVLARPEVDSKELRRAFGCFPTGVCLVTASGPGGPVGMTINSFTSVSLDPPMVLWALARASSSGPVFREAGYFAINVLGASDLELSLHFARSAREKFAAYAERFVPGLGGAPLLEGAAAVFECRTRHCNHGGDHILIIGEVERYTHSEDPPLIFHRGRYAAVA